jgi:pimeloyl-ACP methyl ester carboxylesterase/quercetin dioxygenase-like cupin family protein
VSAASPSISVGVGSGSTTGITSRFVDPYGSSKPTAKWSGSYHDEADVAAAAIRFARNRSEVSKVIVAGESAGAYLACLAAKDGVTADAYLFLGGFCGPGEGIYEYNFGRLVQYAESRPDRREWAEKNLRAELALGRNYVAMFRAAAEGKPDIEISDGDYRENVKLARRQEELKWPPDQMFHHIKAPALALAGEKDLNVPPEHAARAAAIMREAGNQNASSVTIAGCDHSFQRVPADTDEQIRERYTFRSFNRPYEPKVYLETLAWLNRTVPTGVRGAPTTRNATGPAINLRAISRTEIDPKTDTTPERIQLAPGLEIIEDITDKSKTAGVETLEGRIGPLLLAEKCQAHFIDMPAGMFLAEHPHSTESIIYTVRGKWVLCSSGRRHVMKPGSLYRFGANTPTGYEVPFDEPAYILIFKGERSTVVERDFVDYLKGMAERLKHEQAQGTPFLLKDLPADHPAQVFARQANPEWDSRATASQPAMRSTR